MAYHHSVTLDVSKCIGCTNCIKRCPTEAIRIRDGHACIDTKRCIDCGECIRTAEMMDMHCIVFVRSKKPSDEMISLAQESGIVILTTNLRMYEACGILYNEGLNCRDK